MSIRIRLGSNRSKLLGAYSYSERITRNFGPPVFGRTQTSRSSRQSRAVVTSSQAAAMAELPGRPGEYHPESPTDPDVNLSIHPARATQRRLPPSIRIRSSSGFPLTPPDASDLLPLLGGHYPASSLLRSSAPLIGASVLSASCDMHLSLFP